LRSVDLARSQREIDAPWSGCTAATFCATWGGCTPPWPPASSAVPVSRLHEIRTFRTWDDCIVAPRHGFADAADYYARESVAPRLGDLRIPACCSIRRTTRWSPARSVRPALAGASPLLTVSWLPGGGHVAFPRGMAAGLDGNGSHGGIDAQVIAWLRSARSK